MTTKADLVPSGITVRTDPVQQRSAERIALLLDAAASLIDRDGIDGLTTSDVAAKADSSVGVVYRYFTDIQALLRALAARNMDKFTQAIYRAMEEEPRDWYAALNLLIDAYADLMRNEPGFRALRFGDVIDERFLNADRSNNTVLTEQFTELLVGRYELEASDELSFDVEVLVEVGNAMLHRAFLYDPQGDERFIQRLRQMVPELMGKYQPAAAVAAQ
jgi:AcrR family transcriptional regulator